MPYVPKSAAQTFEIGWNKSIAWAQANGMSASSYLPVYQLDLTRLQQGEYPMSAGERNRAILAAHTPNMVTPSTTARTHPQAGNVVANMINTAKDLFTGLIHVPQQLWDSARATVDAVEGKASWEKRTTGSTLGHWMSTTLLSMIPGVADIGTILKADPTLSNAKGFEALAQHPLSSLLDLIPGSEGGLIGSLARRGILGATAAAALEDAGTRSSLLGRLGSLGGDIGTGQVGYIRGQGLGRMTMSQRLLDIASRVGPGGAGVGPMLSDLGADYNLASMMSQNEYSWLMDFPVRNLDELNDAQRDDFYRILDSRRIGGPNAAVQALQDPNIDSAVKQAVQSWLDGPLRFSTEEAIFSGKLKAVEGSEIAGTDTVAGERSYYAVPHIRAIETARVERDTAERAAVEAVHELHPLADEVATLDAMLPQVLQRVLTRVTAARRASAEDEGLLGNVTQPLARPTRLVKARGLAKDRQLQAVIREGGLVDDMIAQIRRDHDPAQMKALAEAMLSRLSKWGPRSVNAAEVPALGGLYQTVDAIRQYAVQYQKTAREIDRRINGTLEDQRHFQKEDWTYAAQQSKALKQRQATERENARTTYEQGRAQARGDFARRINQARASSVQLKAWATEEAEAQAATASRATLDGTIMPALRRRLYEIDQMTADAISRERRDYLQVDKVRRVERQRDVLAMQKRHYGETADLKRQIADRKVGYGEVVRELNRYAKAVNGFQKAIIDHPADEYRDAWLVLFHKHLLEHEESAVMKAETARYVSQVVRAKDREARLAELRSTTVLFAQYMELKFRTVFDDPRMDPEVAQAAKRARDEASAAADDELRTLIAQGFRVQYIPASANFDEFMDRDSVGPLIGRGIPNPDMTKSRAWASTPQRHDAAMGINKAVVQSLQRDSTIDFVEHSIKPLFVTRRQLTDLITTVYGVGAGLTEAAGNLQARYIDRALGDFHLRAFDPERLFGFRLPRWGKEEVYLPSSVVSALEQIQRSRRGILNKGTTLFRYSILGLSPRYDAHILGGGTAMLALRSTPYMPLMLAKAWRAMRDGTIPEIPGRAAVEEGFEDTIFRLWHEQGGRDMVNMMVAEHVERVQRVARAAATPMHLLKALGDLNFRFTRHVRSLQASVAYMDAAAKVERAGRVLIEDPDTGRMVDITARRAMEAGMRHVEEVFGNLGAMSPFERNVATTMLPFYGWQKHILKYVLSFPFDHPWRAVVLSQMADQASQSVPLAFPVRLQLLYFLGSPDKQGNVDALNIDELDPFRTVANYFTLSGVIESLNPAFGAPLTMAFGSQATYGSSALYPTVSYTSFYGIREAGAQGSVLTAIGQFSPQVTAARSALDAVRTVRSEWKTNRSAAIKTLLSNLNIPLVTPPVNLKQLAARGEESRYEVAKTAAYNAFQSGTFKSIHGYRTVPNPLNPDYTISPAQLEALYRFAQKATPGVAPIESLIPPPTPYGY